MKENVLVVLKPDVIAKGLAGHVFSRFESIGLDVVAMKMVAVSKELAEEHYCQLKGQPFYRDIIDYLQGKLHNGHKVVAIVYEGEDAIHRARELAGATNPEDADPKSIRGSLGRITTKGVYENIVHVSSDRKESAREIKLWFTPEELKREISRNKIKAVLA